MDAAELSRLYPRLYHMAAAGSWPLIRDYGLRTTAQLVEASAPAPGIQAGILERRRAHSVVLQDGPFGPVTIRDQGPLRMDILPRVLDGVTVAEWLGMLNGRVFFWPGPDRLANLLAARNYRGEVHDVLTVDTGSLVAAYADRIRLSPINSGAALFPNAARRGHGTFSPIGTYPYEQHRWRGRKNAIAELAVIDGVPDIAQYVVWVECRQRSDVLEVLYP